MHLTLAEIQTELRKVPGFVRFAVTVAGDQIAIEVYRQAPWATLRSGGSNLEQVIHELQAVGKLPSPRKEGL